MGIGKKIIEFLSISTKHKGAYRAPGQRGKHAKGQKPPKGGKK
jgi:hypothetical protein